MYCNHCGKEIEDGSEFCRYCGAKIDGGNNVAIKARHWFVNLSNKARLAVIASIIVAAVAVVGIVIARVNAPIEDKLHMTDAEKRIADECILVKDTLKNPDSFELIRVYGDVDKSNGDLVDIVVFNASNSYGETVLDYDGFINGEFWFYGSDVDKYRAYGADFVKANNLDKDAIQTIDLQSYATLVIKDSNSHYIRVDKEKIEKYIKEQEQSE